MWVDSTSWPGTEEENIGLTFSQEHSWGDQVWLYACDCPHRVGHMDTFSPQLHCFLFSEGLTRFKILGQQHCKSENVVEEGHRMGEFVAVGSFFSLFLFQSGFCFGLSRTNYMVIYSLQCKHYRMSYPIVFSPVLFSCDDSNQFQLSSALQA